MSIVKGYDMWEGYFSVMCDTCGDVSGLWADDSQGVYLLSGWIMFEWSDHDAPRGRVPVVSHECDACVKAAGSATLKAPVVA